ncbi:Protein kinase [Melia azedarach]|uniref:Protein kinase n=1 Tax=Melia azedarach TaxID=155640 RepID=A0ACC1XZN9_MELAZ|nr:Protein kinase [Melia azedarach]
MDAKVKARPRPKLDRRNALKNIEYDASSSPSSPSSDDQSSGGAFRTRSLNFSPLIDHKTSFRIKGIEGEFDVICGILGLSGREDFEIPTAAWEAHKARSSSDASIRLQSQLDRRLGLAEEPEFEGKSKHDEVENGFFVSKKGSGLAGTANGAGPSTGINGERPPALAPPPPMNFQPYLVDDNSSTWDLMKSFAPESNDEDCLHSPVQVEFVNSLDEHEENEVSIGETNIAVDSGPAISDHDENDDDFDVNNHAVSMIMEPVYNVSPNGKFRKRIMSWQKGELLGSGSFGTVYEGFTDDGFFFAVKEVSLLDQGSQGKQSILQLEQEISLLSRFEHKNIVRYYGTDKGENMLYIFLELMTKGSLAKLYQKYKLRDSQASVYTRQILNGLQYLHEQNVIHRDIKCANILVDASGSVKLTDFGLAKAAKMNDIKSCKGTPFWMAPEVVNLKNRSYGIAADIWSLGCTVLELLTGRHPYSELEGMQALYRIGKAELMEHPFVKRPQQTSLGPASPQTNIMQS